MWTALQRVGSPITLVAFLLAIMATIGGLIAKHLSEKQRGVIKLLEKAAVKDLPMILALIKDRYHFQLTEFPQKDRAKLIELIKTHELSKLKCIMIFAAFVALLTAAIVIVAFVADARLAILTDKAAREKKAANAASQELKTLRKLLDDATNDMTKAAIDSGKLTPAEIAENLRKSVASIRAKATAANRPLTPEEERAIHDAEAVLAKLDEQEALQHLADKPIGMIVPLYVYPIEENERRERMINSSWRTLMESVRLNQSLHLIAIANPGVGPGRDTSPDYESLFRQFRSSRSEIVGFVNCLDKTDEQIRIDVAQWASLYRRQHSSVGGIYFSRLDCPADGLDGRDRTQSCKRIFAYACEVLKDAVQVPSPIIAVSSRGELGEQIMEANPYREFEQLRESRFILCVESESGDAPPKRRSWQKSYPATNFAELTFAVEKRSEMEALVKRAAYNNIGWIYYTNLLKSNPAMPGTGEWSRLADYWLAEVDALMRINDVIEKRKDGISLIHQR